MSSLGEAYGRDITPATVRVFFNVLSGYSIEQVEHAAAEIMSNHDWFPAPAAVKREIERLRGAGSGIVYDQETQARNQARLLADHVAGRGYMHEGEELDRVTRELMRGQRYSMESLRRTLLESEVKWFIKDFVEDYLAMKMRIDTLPIGTGTPERIGESGPRKRRDLGVALGKIGTSISRGAA
jgi:hypothetical protein